MGWDRKVELGLVVDAILYGEPVTTTTWTTVYANKKSIGQKEFYESRVAGLKPELVFEVRTFEYGGQTRIRFNGNIYEVIRTYIKDDYTELVVSAHTGSDL